MSLRGTLSARSPITGRQWGAVVSGFGVVFGVVELVHIRAMSTPLGIALEAVLPFIGAIGFVVAGYVLWTERYLYDGDDAPRIVGWIVVGMVGIGTIFLWVLSHQWIRGGEFHHAHFIMVNTLIAGGLVGFVIGTYDAQSRSYRRSIQQERLKHDFLNRELRHHVLNGMQIIFGNLERIDRDDTSPPDDAITTIREEGEEIVDRVESVRRIGKAFTERGTVSLEPTDLSRVLIDAVEEIDARYGGAVISTDVPEGVTVRADQFLPLIFENLLSNAVEHNDKDPPRVRVSLAVEGSAAVVRIADNGPGLPEGDDSLLAWEEPAGGSIGMGVGLAIANVLTNRYGGRIWMEENRPTGTVACVELDVSEAPQASE